MRRRLLNLLTVLSLLLSLAAAVLWWRSYTVADNLTWSQAGGEGRKCVFREAVLSPSRGRISAGLTWGDLSFATREEAAGARDRRVTQGGLRWRPGPPIFLLPRSQSLWGRLGFGPAGFHSSLKSPVGKAAEWQAPPPTLVREREAFVILPLWSVVAGGLALPMSRAAIHLRRRRAARAERSGACTRCGYDLRATPERCPECGTMPGPEPAA